MVGGGAVVLPEKERRGGRIDAYLGTTLSRDRDTSVCREKRTS